MGPQIWAFRSRRILSPDRTVRPGVTAGGPMMPSQSTLSPTPAAEERHARYPLSVRKHYISSVAQNSDMNSAGSIAN